MAEERIETDHDLIVRMDERVKQAVTIMEQRDIYHRGEMDRMSKMFLEVIGSFTATITSMQTGFATKGDLASANGSISKLERTVYGACAVIMLGFIGALVAMVFRGG
jgi:hypothetical protein